MTANEGLAVEAVDPARTDRLVIALKALAEDTKALLAATSGEAGQQMAEARARASDSLTAALAHAGDVQDSTLAQTRSLGRATDVYVREHRWEVLAASAVAGFAIGALLMRRGVPKV